MAETFSQLEETVTAKPTIDVRKKVWINFFKTALFLLGISIMILNQARKDRSVQTATPVNNTGTVTIGSEQAVLVPFSFFK